MEDWRIEATEKLKQYEARRQALEIIPMQIAEIESTMTSIRSASMDGVSVRTSKGTAREDMLLNCMVQKDELQRSLERARIWVNIVDRGLSILDPEERKVLDRAYIKAECHAADNLAAECFVDVKTIYRWKEKALRKFTIALYGFTES